MTASNYGGPKHPQWYYNLKAHPECELGGEKFVTTEITDSENQWDAGVKHFQQFWAWMLLWRRVEHPGCL